MPRRLAPIQGPSSSASQKEVGPGGANADARERYLVLSVAIFRAKMNAVEPDYGPGSRQRT